MALKAVGFDIDGTLYPENRGHWRSIGFFLSNIRIIRAFSQTRRLMRGSGFDDEDSEIRLFACALHCDTDAARTIRDTVIYRGWEQCLRNIRIYPGVRSALTQLKNAGLKLAALSDFPVGNKLDYFGLADIFDVALGFPESGRLKPDAAPFLMMAERLCVDPKDILYIGNSLRYDFHGSTGSGMQGALIGSQGRKAPEDVTVFSDYRHLADSILTEVLK